MLANIEIENKTLYLSIIGFYDESSFKQNYFVKLCMHSLTFIF